MFYLCRRAGVADPAMAGRFYLNSGAESIVFGAGLRGLSETVGYPAVRVDKATKRVGG